MTAAYAHGKQASTGPIPPGPEVPATASPNLSSPRGTRMVLMGPPGAGKGTQAELISERLGIPTISTGEIFRSSVKRDTQTGRSVKRYLDAGELVPDELTNAMVRERLGESDVEDGFLLDGFPRNIRQAAQLDALLADLGGPLTLALDLVLDSTVVVDRLSARRMCESCGHISQLDLDAWPPLNACDLCGGMLARRADDDPATVAHRLDVYAAHAAGLIEFYRSTGRLESIDASGTVENVARRAFGAIARHAA